MRRPHVNPHNRQSSRKATRRPQRRRKNRLRTPRIRRLLRKLNRARPPPPRRQLEPGRRPIRTRRREPTAPQARRPEIQRKILRLGRIPAIPPVRGRKNRPDRDNRPTLPAILTREHLTLRRLLATLATPLARGPRRSP